MLRGFFCGCRAGKLASEIPEIVYAFGPQLNAFMAVGILPKCFRGKLLQFYIADQVEFRRSFYKNCTLLQSKFHI